MPVLECHTKTNEGLKVGYIIPTSKISHLSFIGIEKEREYFLHTMSGAKLKIAKADYNKLHDIILEQEGVKQ